MLILSSRNQSPCHQGPQLMPLCIFLECLHVLSSVQLLETPWTVAHQAPLSLELSRQEYQSGLLLLGIFPAQGSNPHLLSPTLAGGFFTAMPPGKPFCGIYYLIWQKGWHHWLGGCKSEQTPGDGEGQGSLVRWQPMGVTECWTWLSDWTKTTSG